MALNACTSAKGIPQPRRFCNDELVQAVLAGEYQIIFLSPEVLLTELRWREMLRKEVYQNNLVGVIVDEAHCVETW